MGFIAWEFFEFYNASDKRTALTCLTSIIFMLHTSKKIFLFNISTAIYTCHLVLNIPFKAAIFALCIRNL